MTDVQIIAEALWNENPQRLVGWDVTAHQGPFLERAEAVVAALVSADRLVVNRDDLESAAACVEYRARKCSAEGRSGEGVEVAALAARLRSVLTEGGEQQDEPEDDHWHWLDDRTGRIYHEGDVFGVRSGRDVTLHRLRCTCDPVPEWIVDNAEAKGWDLSPDVAPLPRTRPPRSHRDDESLRRWEARHPSVRFPPTTPLEQECDHEWRSSFGDTFCEKCNQDAPVEIASERCRTCKGSGTWADEGWSKPPQPCKACSGSGLAPIRKRKPTVPVQQDEPECER